MSKFAEELRVAQTPVKDALSPRGMKIYQEILLATWERYGYRDPRPLPIAQAEGGGATLRFEGAEGRSFVVCLCREGDPVYCVHEDAAGNQTSAAKLAARAPFIADFARKCFEEE